MIEHTPSAIQGPFASEWDSLRQYRCPDWFRDAKFGIWSHWGPQCVPRVGDWYARHIYKQPAADDARAARRQYTHHVQHYGHPSKFGYKDVIPLWKAERFDPDRLMALYAIALGVSPDGVLRIRSLGRTTAHGALPIANVELLAAGGTPLAFQREPDALVVNLPRDVEFKHAVAVRLRGAVAG